ncbi:hypothetical protein [Halodurantibacterium flavum]|uniref:Uncharacterized protein n=1 Tax=Halodurantibacterium flavum TaxID=1382802 RepID=A0ABW4S8A8_9RHOB
MAGSKKDGGKIAENPSAANLAAMLPLVDVMAAGPDFLKLLGLSPEIISELQKSALELQDHANILTLPDEFNAQFANQGWIATGALSPEVMRNALAHSREGNSEAAEAEILSWFTEDRIRLFAITRGKRFNKAQARYHQMVEALSLYKEERYISAVPLILIVCDGLASDVLGGSPFEKDADLSCFDSITGHPTSLPKLIKLVTKGVRKSSDDVLSLPMRHGILHGRSVNYASKAVCCKAWLLLIALVDWACDKVDEEARRNRHETEQEQTLVGSLSKLRKTQEDKRKLNAWVPVVLTAPFDQPFEPGSPGEAFQRFFSGWKAKNYGMMAAHAVNLADKSPRALAGELRRDCEFIELLDFDLVKVVQANQARADVTLDVRGKTLKGPVEGRINATAVCYLPNGDPAMPTDDGGTWCVQQNCIYKVMHLDIPSEE